MSSETDAADNVADYVIVGAGSAGAAVAGRVSAAGHSVVLLEAGPADRKTAIRIPAAFPQLFRTEVDWDYTTQPQKGLGGRSVYWPRGKTLGGSSSMNAMMWVPGFPADYDEWASIAGPDWSFAAVSKYLDKITSRSSGLGIHIEELRSPNPYTAQFLDAAQQLGYSTSDAADSMFTGFAPTTVTQSRGARFSTADGYLRPAQIRRNLEIVTGARANRVIFDGQRAIGVEYSAQGSIRRAIARREVVISAGAVNTPQLLMLSGIGDPVELRSLGIDVVAAAAAVGTNLVDHLVTGLAVESEAPTLFSAGRARHIAQYLTRRRGPLTSNVVEARGFVHSNADLQLPDLEIVFLPVPFIDEGLTEPDRHGFTVGTVLLRPQSSGTVRLASKDPAAKPIIDPGYLSDPDGADDTAFRAGVDICRRFIETMTRAGHCNGRYIRPVAGHRLTPDALVTAAVEDIAQTIYHPVGTARMGSDETSVVDPQLRVRGVHGLRIADTSIMPTIIRGHTHAPAVVVGERCADLLLTS
ncbi:GMC family oxidoreductase [Nocardia sp. NPDC055049]